MAVTVPNLNELISENPKLGEAFKSLQDYINKNTTQAAGTNVASLPAAFGYNPTRPPV